MTATTNQLIAKNNETSILHSWEGSHNNDSSIGIRYFSKKGEKKNKKKDSEEPKLSYLERKKLKKELRTQRYNAHEERLERLKVRQKNQPDRGKKKNEFRSWFIATKVDDEYANRDAKRLGLGWKIRVATILERLPIILPDKEDWERDWDVFKAYKNQFGKVMPKPYGPGEDLVIEPEENFTEEAMAAHFPRGFEPAPRETEADKTGNVNTLDRKLKTRVYLNVQDDNDITNKWNFPSVSLKDDETLLDAAKRAIAEKVDCPKELNIWYPSNCPIAVDLNIYDENSEERQKDKLYGEKIFFMKFQYEYDEGEVQTTKKNQLAWLDRDEIGRAHV